MMFGEKEIYVVQFVDGVLITATDNYEQALKALNTPLLNAPKRKLSVFIDGKIIAKDLIIN
ncbi:hypothetical protein [Lysinibacillus xylanilyticus]|uniref:hypothetical protein n=1 Tax=Lysinibacillus xylanilyticus TaxID=582475 RepID=UPI003D0554DE